MFTFLPHQYYRCSDSCSISPNCFIYDAARQPVNAYLYQVLVVYDWLIKDGVLKYFVNELKC